MTHLLLLFSLRDNPCRPSNPPLRSLFLSSYVMRYHSKNSTNVFFKEIRRILIKIVDERKEIFKDLIFLQLLELIYLSLGTEYKN